jgi:hypothetical protein
LAKERDFPVDGSSDSEDDNEIPLPRYKNKSSWIPKPSNISFLDLLMTVSFWSLLISLCLENLLFHLVVSPEVTDDSDGTIPKYFLASFLSQL